MPRPYSQDLRDRVVGAVEAGSSARAAGRVFGVSESTAVKWVQRWRRTGTVAAKRMGGYARSPLEDHAALVLGFIAERPDLTIEEVRAALRARGIGAGHGSVWRFFNRHGISFKKRDLPDLLDTRPRRVHDEGMLEHTKAILGVVIAILLGWGAQLMWPQASVELVWSLALLASIAWLVIHYRERIFVRSSSGQRQLSLDLIPLIDGIDKARVALNAELQDNPIVQSSHAGGENIFEALVFEMLGTDDSVPVYAVKPPMKTPEVVHDIYLKYRIASDGTAIHNMDPGDTLTNLQVRRSDVERCIKNYLKGGGA